MKLKWKSLRYRYVGNILYNIKFFSNFDAKTKTSGALKFLEDYYVKFLKIKFQFSLSYPCLKFSNMNTGSNTNQIRLKFYIHALHTICERLTFFCLRNWSKSIILFILCINFRQYVWRLAKLLIMEAAVPLLRERASALARAVAVRYSRTPRFSDVDDEVSRRARFHPRAKHFSVSKYASFTRPRARRMKMQRKREMNEI